MQERLGRYTLRIPLNKSETILFNLISKMNIKVPVENQEDVLVQYLMQNTDSELLGMLKERYILVPQDYDDFAEFWRVKNYYNSQTEKGTFLIHTNYTCNLRCSYCYQDSTTQKKGVMLEETVYDVINFISLTAKTHSYKTLDICFIGGEPLLQSDKIIRIARSLNESLSIDIRYSVVTNGTIYSDQIVESLLAQGVNELQITLDGSKAIHDKLRFYKGGRGSYIQIINNLCKLQRYYPDMHVVINCNINQYNEDNIETFLVELRNHEVMFPISFSLVFDNDNGLTHESHKKTVWFDTHIKAMKYGYSFKPFYREMFLGCAMTQKHYHIIGVDGDIYKCINAVNDPHYRVGSLREYGSPSYLNNVDRFLQYFPAEKMCKECELLPICYGGCPYKNRNKPFHCDKESFYHNDIPLIKELYIQQCVEESYA